jgi:hypothetical protein
MALSVETRDWVRGLPAVYSLREYALAGALMSLGKSQRGYLRRPHSYASRLVLPPPLQGSLPAGWLAFTRRESNPQDRYKRFQIAVSSSFSGFILAQGKFHFEPPSCFISLDHLVGAQQERLWDCQSERLRGSQIQGDKSKRDRVSPCHKDDHGLSIAGQGRLFPFVATAQ